MNSQKHMSVKFWGVRGSIACPGNATSRYGGNTSCVEIKGGKQTFIFDAGTGLRELGKTFPSTGKTEINIFLSHCHIDHICGLPFFAPCYSRMNTVRLWAGNLLPRFRLGEVIEQMMAAPLFPIRHDIFDADLQFRDFHVGETLAPSSAIKLRTIRLNHPDGATGYRVEYDGRSIAYVTDHESHGDTVDQHLASFLKDVDLLICDCTYTAEELRTHLGWGHSSWQQGIQLAAAARAKRFCLFHHDPDHDDVQLDRIAAEVSKQHPGSMVAYEGLIVEI
jgi:phosphoribosyl 1,2-cyclic phosphodiesterase